MTNNIIDELELSVRAGNILRKAGVETLEQFMALTAPQVMALQHAGVKVWREIEMVQKSLRPSVEARLVEISMQWNRMVLEKPKSLLVKMDPNTGMVEVYRKLSGG